MITKVADGNGGKWIVKRKFGMALLCLVGAFVIAWTQSSSLGEWTAFCTMILALIFAADVADKKLNGGGYHE
jgi:hypothetical protein